MTEALWIAILSNVVSFAIGSAGIYFVYRQKEKRIPSENFVDDASAAAAYAQLNKELREELESVRQRLTDLESAKINPLRITVDFTAFPAAEIRKATIVSLASDEQEITPSKGAK